MTALVLALALAWPWSYVCGLSLGLGCSGLGLGLALCGLVNIPDKMQENLQRPGLRLSQLRKLTVGNGAAYSAPREPLASKGGLYSCSVLKNPTSAPQLLAFQAPQAWALAADLSSPQFIFHSSHPAKTCMLLIVAVTY